LPRGVSVHSDSNKGRRNDKETKTTDPPYFKKKRERLNSEKEENRGKC